MQKYPGLLVFNKPGGNGLAVNIYFKTIETKKATAPSLDHSAAAHPGSRRHCILLVLAFQKALRGRYRD